MSFSKKISFILPVYNVQKYLPICLESILNQSITNFEIICIDDCSTDDSFTILSEYQKNDSRMIVFRFEKNKGPGAARNKGLALASGEFIRMVDPDDFLPTSSTEDLLHAAALYKSDIVRGGVWYCDEAGRKKNRNVLSPKKRVKNASMDYQMINYLPHHWAFLFRTSVLRSSGVQYDKNMRNGQDAAFMIDLLPFMKKVSLIPEVVYCYRVNSGSTMRRKREISYYVNIFSLYSRANRHLSCVGLQEVADSYFYSHCCHYLPRDILSSIPENLSVDDGVVVLERLKILIDEINGRSLCFTEKYFWQKKRTVPAIMKYILLLLENDMFVEAYNALLENGLRRQKTMKLDAQVNLLKKRINKLYISTSWKLTAPLRVLGDVIR